MAGDMANDTFESEALDEDMREAAVRSIKSDCPALNECLIAGPNGDGEMWCRFCFRSAHPADCY